MKTKLGLLSVFSLILLMVVPVNAEVTSLSLEKSFYTTEENFKIIGTQDGGEIVYVIIRDQAGNYRGMVSDPTTTQGEFDAIPRPVSLFFDNKGIYNATAFTDSQKEVNGTSILLEFDGKKVFEIPSFVLQLKGISDKTVEVEKTITFTATLTDSSIEDAVFSLDNEPAGATIDAKTGKFVWTPSKSQGNIQDVHYNFDVIVKKGSQEDTEEITITVKQAYVEPEPKEIVCPQGFEPVNGKCPDKPVVKNSKELAAFVDETKDPQSYVDRYNNEASYKKWFDDNYSELTIYEAVGLDEPEVKEPEFGQCGKGTRLVENVCTIFDEIEYGQCGEGTELVGKVCEIIGKTKVNEKPWWRFW